MWRNGGANGSEASIEAARLALRMATALGDEDTDFALEFEERFPSILPAFESLRVLRSRIEEAETDRRALTGLLERCIYVTSCLVVKCMGAFVFMDIGPLVDCIEEAEMVARKGRRRERDMREVHTNITELVTDMGLSDIMEFENKADGLLQALVGF